MKPPTRIFLSAFRFQPPTSPAPVDGVPVLRKFAFTVGHYDKHKTPAWVAMRWSKEPLDVSLAEPRHPRPFRADPDLPNYARTGSDYQHDEFASAFLRCSTSNDSTIPNADPASSSRRRATWQIVGR